MNKKETNITQRRKVKTKPIDKQTNDSKKQQRRPKSKKSPKNEKRRRSQFISLTLLLQLKLIAPGSKNLFFEQKKSEILSLTSYKGSIFHYDSKLFIIAVRKFGLNSLKFYNSETYKLDSSQALDRDFVGMAETQSKQNFGLVLAHTRMAKIVRFHHKPFSFTMISTFFFENGDRIIGVSGSRSTTHIN